MKHSLMSILFLLVIALTANHAIADESCKEQIKKYRELNGKIAAAEFSRDLRQRAKELQDILSKTDASLGDASDRAGKVSEGIDDKKQQAEQIAERLKPVLDKLDVDVGKLTDVLDQVKAGTDQFKGSLDTTKGRISNVDGFLSSAIAAADASKGSESLAALESYFNQLNSILGPLTGTIPVVGNFLELYAHAISSAKTVAEKLEARVERDNKISQAIGGYDIYLDLSNRDDSLEKLLDQRDALVAAMEESGCEDEEAEEEQAEASASKDVPQEVIDACVRNAAATADYGVRALRARRDVSARKDGIKQLEAKIDAIEFDLSQAEKKAAEVDENNRTARRLLDQAVDNARKRYRDQPEFAAKFPASFDDVAEFCRVRAPARETAAGGQICSKWGLVNERLQEEIALKARVPQLERSLASTKEKLDLARQTLKIAEGDSATFSDLEDRVEACIRQTMAASDLSGVWLRDSRPDDPYKVTIQGSTLVMSKGQAGEGGVVMSASVAGKALEDKTLQNAKWKFDFGGQCPQTVLWVPFDASTWADNTIRGRIPHYVLGEGCKAKRADVPDKLLLMFGRKLD